MVNTLSTYSNLLELINARQATVGIMGLGYVGLPLALEFANKGFNVIGFEKDALRIQKLNEKISYIKDVSSEEVASAFEKKFTVTLDVSQLAHCDAIIICVPTPLDKYKKPDMSYIQMAGEDIARNLKKNSFISLESTTYPTTTENFLLPLIEEISGLKHDRDFWICFSAERIDPGNLYYKTDNIPKVVGGLGKTSQTLGFALYSQIIKTVHSVSSPRIAEMCKILENTYRLVNISLINEMALLCGKMDIDIWETIEAAKTKPYGFHAFYPGPGIGGHCIPLDPFYLEHIARDYNFDLSMIKAAGAIEDMMPHRMLVKIESTLNKYKLPINGAKLLFVGVAYKADVNDARESPVIKIMEKAAFKGAELNFYDPYILEITVNNKVILNDNEFSEKSISRYDCIVIGTAHTAVSYEMLNNYSKPIIDLRNAMKGLNCSNVFKL